MKVLIVYFSKTGHTREAALAISEGMKEAGSTVNIVGLIEFKPDSIGHYDRIIFGAPCWAGSINKKGVPGPVKKALNALSSESLKDKPCAAFSIQAWKGAEYTIKNIGLILKEKGCSDFTEGPIAKAGTPFSIGKGSSITSEDLKKFKEFGAHFIQ